MIIFYMSLEMKCKKAEKYLAAIVDGELRGWWRRRALMKHCEKCALCRKMVEMQKQIKNLLWTKAQRVNAPDELRAKIHKQLEEQLH